MTSPGKAWAIIVLLGVTGVVTGIDVAEAQEVDDVYQFQLIDEGCQDDEEGPSALRSNYYAYNFISADNGCEQTSDLNCNVQGTGVFGVPSAEEATEGCDPDTDAIRCTGPDASDEFICENSAPTINEDTKIVFEDNPLAFQVNASDADNDTLQFDMNTNATDASLDATSGNFSWTPASGSVGTYYANFSVNDSKEESWQNITITVLEPAASLTSNGTTPSDAPRVVNFTLNATNTSMVAQDATFDDGLGNTTDLRQFTNQSLEVNYISSGIYTAWFNGTYNGTPFAQNVTTTVLNVPPVLDAIGDKITVESKPLAFTVNASNDDGDDLTFAVQTDIPADSYGFVNNTNGGKDFSWTPVLGTYYANFTVNDGKDVDWENITITVADRSTALTSDWPKALVGSPLTFTLNAIDPSKVADGATFDDGLGNSMDLGTFANQTIDVTYPSAGTYTAWFNGTHASESVFNHNVSVQVLQDPLTNFTANVTQGTSPLLVNFSLIVNDTWNNIDGSITFDDGLGNVNAFQKFFNTTEEVTYDQNGTYVAWFNGTHEVTGPFNHAIQVHLTNTAPMISPIGNRDAYRAHELVIDVVATDPDVEDALTYAMASNATGATLDPSTGQFSWNVTEDESGWYYANVTANDTKEEAWENITITVQDPSTVFSTDFVGGVNGSAPLEVEYTFSDPDWSQVSDMEFTNGTEPESDVVFVANGTVPAVYDEPGDYIAWFNGTHETEGRFWYSIPVTVVPNTAPVFTDNIGDQIVVKNNTLDFTVTAVDAEDSSTLTFDLHTNATNYTSEDLPSNARNFTWTPTEDDIGWYHANFSVRDGKGGVTWKNITITVTELSTAFSSDATSGYAPFTVTFTLDATDWDDIENATFDAGNGSATTDVAENTSIPVVYGSPATAWFNGTHADEGDFNHSISISIKVPPTPPVFDAIPDMDDVVESDRIDAWILAAHQVDDPSELTYDLQTDIPDDPSINFTANDTIGGMDFSWQTDYGDAGTYYANFTVNDTFGQETFHNVTITILDNQAPVIEPIDDQQVVEGNGFFIPVEIQTDEQPESLVFDVITDIDAEQQPIFGPVVGGPESAAFSWSSGFDTAGTYYANFTATDPEGLVGHENVTITVLPNTAPVLEAIGDQTVGEGDRIGFTVPANDSDGHVLTYGIESDLPTGDANHAFFDQTTGEFTWTAAFGDAGAYYADFSVTDGGATVHENVTITVLGNAAPVLDSIGDRFVEEGDTIAFHVNASDAEGDTMTFGVLTGTKTNITGASYSDNALGGKDFNWTPTSQDIGPHYANFTVSAGNKTDWENVTITVRPSIPPVLDPIGNLSIEEGDEYHLIVKAKDPGDEAGLTFSFKSNSTNVSFDPDSREFSWEPEEGTVGWYWAKFKVTDDDGLSDVENVTLAVMPYSPEPTTDSSGAGGGGGTRAATQSERSSLAQAGMEIEEDDEVMFVDDDGDGDADSITSSSGRLEVAHDVDSISVLVFTDKQTGKMAVMDFATGEASPVKGIEESDTEVKPVKKPSTDEEEQFDVTVPKEDGWIHIEIDDPAPGQNITSLNRSDGVVLELDQAWRTADGKLHIIDDPDTTYTVGFEPVPKESKVWLWILISVLGALVVAGGVIGGIYWWRRRYELAHTANRAFEEEDPEEHWTEDGGAELEDSWALASEIPN